MLCENIIIFKKLVRNDSKEKLDYKKYSNFKEFEIFLWKKRRFRLRWDSSPGLSIAG